MPKAGTAFVDIVPRLERLRRDLERHMPGVADKSARSFASKFATSVGGLGRTIAKGLAVGVIAGGAAAAAGITKAVLAGADLNETLSKTGEVFGTSTSDVTRFADEMGRSFGLNKKELLDAASAFGLIGKGAGLAEPQIAAMSTNMAGLAADASSFFNVPLDVALEKIRAGLVGEAEPLRAFGVLLSEAAVQEEAVALGIAKAGEKLDEQQKIMARSSLITKGLSTASGDLERTQGSLSNVLRGIGGQFSNLAADLGLKMLPAATAIATVVKDKLVPALGTALTGAVERLTPMVQERLVPAIVTFADKLPALVDDGLPKLIHAFETIGPLAADVGKAFASLNSADGAAIAITAMTARLLAATGPLGIAVGLGIALGLAINRLTERFLPGVNRALERFGGFIFDAVQKLGGFKQVAITFAGAVVPFVRILERIVAAFVWLKNNLPNIRFPKLPSLPSWIPGIGGNRGGSGRGSGGGSSSFQFGGMVPGPIGAARLALVHGGEQVLTPGQQRSHGGTAGDVFLDGTLVGRWVARDLADRRRSRA